MTAYPQERDVGSKERDLVVPDASFYSGMPDSVRDELLNDMRRNQVRMLRDLSGRNMRGIGYEARSNQVFEPGHHHELVPEGQTILYTNFEGADNFTINVTGSGAAGGLPGLLFLSTDTTNPSSAEVLDVSGAFLGGAAFAQRGCRFRTRAFFNTQAANQIAYIATGLPNQAAGTATEGEEGFGFKVDDATLYAFHSYNDGVDTQTEVLTAVSNIDITTDHEYAAVFDRYQIRFRVDGEEVAVHKGNMPSFDQYCRMYYYIENDGSAADRSMLAAFFYFQQETADRTIVDLI